MDKIIILFRCDASEQTGFGHLSRCSGLACALISDMKSVQIIFAMRGSDNEIVDYYVNEFGRVRLEEYDINLSSTGRADFREDDYETRDAEVFQNLVSRDYKDCFIVVIVDHYLLGNDWLSKIESNVNCAIAIDDLNRNLDSFDLVVDLNLCNDVQAGNTRLSGVRYYLFGKNFLDHVNACVNETDFEKQDKDVMISLGSENIGLTERLVEFFKSRELKITWLIGRSKWERIENYHVVFREKDWDVYNYLVDPFTLMKQHKINIGSAGVSSIERMCLGLPSIVYKVAENQSSNVGFISGLGMHVFAEFDEVKLSELLITLNDKKNLIANRPEIDHLGSVRTSNHIFNALLFKCLFVKYSSKCYDLSSIAIRSVCSQDEELLFILQTIPDIRNWSRNPNPPNIAEHSAWFHEAIKSNDIRMWFLQLGNFIFGYFRLDYKVEYEEISILVRPECQNKGLGSIMVQAAIKFSKCKYIKACVNKENLSSVNLFIKNGFVKCENDCFIYEVK